MDLSEAISLALKYNSPDLFIAFLILRYGKRILIFSVPDALSIYVILTSAVLLCGKFARSGLR